jgi:ribonuclease-3
LDQGYEKAAEFIKKNILIELPKILKQKLYRDPKSSFQEESQDRAGITPTYEVLKEWGPDHDKHFVVGVFLEKELSGQGEGLSKQGTFRARRGFKQARGPAQSSRRRFKK